MHINDLASKNLNANEKGLHSFLLMENKACMIYKKQRDNGLTQLQNIIRIHRD